MATLTHVSIQCWEADMFLMRTHWNKLKLTKVYVSLDSSYDFWLINVNITFSFPPCFWHLNRSELGSSYSQKSVQMSIIKISVFRHVFLIQTAAPPLQMFSSAVKTHIYQVLWITQFCPLFRHLQSLLHFSISPSYLKLLVPFHLMAHEILNEVAN